MSERSNHLLTAVDWYVKLTAEDASEADKKAWAVWLSQNKQNEVAWQEIKDTLNMFQSVPSKIGIPVLTRDTNRINLQRRKSLKHFATFVVTALPIGKLIQDSIANNFYYDYSTNVGERKQVILADGTTLTLNTNSAATVNISLSERTIKLHRGEVHISTNNSNPLHRPLLSVKTSDGSVMSSNTRLNVRKFSDFTRISLFEGKLEITPRYNNLKFNLNGNEEIDMFSTKIVLIRGNKNLFGAWLDGYVEVNNLALQTFIEELGRYWHGFLVCHPNVRNIKISGSYSVEDINRSLNSLSRTFPIKIQHITRFLTMILPTN